MHHPRPRLEEFTMVLPQFPFPSLLHTNEICYLCRPHCPRHTLLWKDRAPKVFDMVIGGFIDEATAHGSVMTRYLYPQPSSTKRASTKRTSSKKLLSKSSSDMQSSTTYNIYEAILGKVISLPCKKSIWWAEVFDDLHPTFVANTCSVLLTRN